MGTAAMIDALRARREKEYRKRVRRAVILIRKHDGKAKKAHLISRISDLCRVNTNDVMKEMRSLTG
jgi:geranylgeranyl pyrophosphate synthase